MREVGVDELIKPPSEHALKIFRKAPKVLVDLPPEMKTLREDGTEYKFYRKCPDCGIIYGTNLLMQGRCNNCAKLRPKFEIRCVKCGTIFPSNNRTARFCEECRKQRAYKSTKTFEASRTASLQPPENLPMRRGRKPFDAVYEYVLANGSIIRTTYRKMRLAAGLLVGKPIDTAAKESGYSPTQARRILEEQDFQKLMDDMAGDYTLGLKNAVQHIIRAQLLEIIESLNTGRLRPQNQQEARQWVALAIDLQKHMGGNSQQYLGMNDKKCLENWYNRGVSDDSPPDPFAVDEEQPHNKDEVDNGTTTDDGTADNRDEF